jgi:hypothetical protein
MRLGLLATVHGWIGLKRETFGQKERYESLTNHG